MMIKLHPINNKSNKKIKMMSKINLHKDKAINSKMNKIMNNNKKRKITKKQLQKK
jgi:hypothetical protein